MAARLLCVQLYTIYGVKGLKVCGGGQATLIVCVHFFPDWCNSSLTYSKCGIIDDCLQVYTIYGVKGLKACGGGQATLIVCVHFLPNFSGKIPTIV